MKNENDAPTTFGLLRHGKTEWNRVNRIQGSADSPLCPEGKAQTREWIRTLREYCWDRILASDLGRVQQTVEILNAGLRLPVTFDKRLREQDWGDWEGLTVPYIQENFKKELERRVAWGWDFSAPGGESRLEVITRVFQTLAEAAEEWPGRKILVVCHQGVLKCSLYRILQRNFVGGEDPLLQHNSLHLVNFERGCFAVRQLNIARQL
jgi:broad specificity phosphatase PhoE